MNTKEILINSITINLSERLNVLPKEIKQVLIDELRDYTVVKMDVTLPTTGDGSTTKYLFKKFAESKVAKGMNQKTLYQYQLAISQLWESEHVELNLITADNIRHFMARMRATGAKDATIVNKYRLISSVFTFLKRNKYIVENPFEEAEKPKEKIILKQPLSDSEVESIRIASEQRGGIKAARTAAMFNFMLDTGVRVSELCGIRLTDINFDDRTARVLGKGNKERIVYFTDRTLTRIQKYLSMRPDLKVGNIYVYNPNAPFIASYDKYSAPIKPCGVRFDMEKLGQASGVERLHPHLVRATFATNLAQKGVNVDVIARLLGHSDLRTIKRYVLLSDEQIRQMLAKVS